MLPLATLSVGSCTPENWTGLVIGDKHMPQRERYINQCDYWKTTQQLASAAIAVPSRAHAAGFVALPGRLEDLTGVARASSVAANTMRAG